MCKTQWIFHTFFHVLNDSSSRIYRMLWNLQMQSSLLKLVLSLMWNSWRWHCIETCRNKVTVISCTVSVFNCYVTWNYKLPLGMTISEYKILTCFLNILGNTDADRRTQIRGRYSFNHFWDGALQQLYNFILICKNGTCNRMTQINVISWESSSPTFRCASGTTATLDQQWLIEHF